MIEVKDLTGADLARWVAHAIGYEEVSAIPHDLRGMWWAGEADGGVKDWAPHEDWSQGGPLIFKFDIAIGKGANQIVYPGWNARVGPVTAYNPDDGRQFGPTPLIAAMRALVWSVYGDTVQEVAP